MKFLLILFLVITTIIISALLVQIRIRTKRLEREDFVRSYVFSNDLFVSLQKKYSLLAERDIFLVARALRQYFIVHIRAGQKVIGMPSKVVDDLWHEFILDTRAYQDFCNRAFGAYFHHIPASATQKGIDIGTALRVTWRYACLEENINPNHPVRLPLLFAIDEKLQIADGNIYNLKTTQNPSGDSGGCGGMACGGGSDCGNGGCCGDGGGGCSGGCGGGCGGG